jgi:putative glycerol-1-phosphate prenyltransferase
MIQELSQWRHVFKLDPDRYISDEDLDQLCLSGTDAIIVGGSTGVTFENTVDLLSRIRKYELSCVLEVSAADAIVPGFDLYLIPMVLNTDNAQWVTGNHQRAIREYGATLPWDRVVVEGYVILNEHSTAAQITEAIAVHDEKDFVAYVRMADRLLCLPILYIEYSGIFGNMEWVRRAKTMLHQAQVFYGGGIDSATKAREAAEAAHTIVVGNIIYDNLQKALETVEAAKD